MENKAKRGRGRPRKAEIGKTLFIPSDIVSTVELILRDYREKQLQKKIIR
jgi:hypothetical protein